MTRRPLVVAAAVGGVVLLALALLPLRTHEVSGTVREAASGRPLEGIDVWVHYWSWGLVDGQLVWDESHVFPSVTDSSGRYHITYRGPSNVQLNVRADGYQWFQTWTAGATEIDAVLEPDRARAVR